MGPDAMILVFWMLSFKSTFSLSSFTFIKRLFNSSLLAAVRVVSSAYLRLLIFLLEILIPACASSSLKFHMLYYAYKLNKQGDLSTLFLFNWNLLVSQSHWCSLFEKLPSKPLIGTVHSLTSLCLRNCGQCFPEFYFQNMNGNISALQIPQVISPFSRN